MGTDAKHLPAWPLMYVNSHYHAYKLAVGEHAEEFSDAVARGSEITPTEGAEGDSPTTEPDATPAVEEPEGDAPHKHGNLYVNLSRNVLRRGTCYVNWKTNVM